MCSELFRVPYTWGGVPIFGIGLLLAIWAVATLITVVGQVRRHGWGSETLGALPVLLLVGAAIVFLPRVFPEGLPVRGYGVMLLLGIVAGVGMAMYRAQQGGVGPDAIISLAIWMVVTGIIGARLFYVIEYWQQNFAGRSPRDTLLEILNVPEGGLVVYGGLIGAAIGFIVFNRKHRLPILAMADLVAPCMAIGLALGRIGCFLNGCCYGGETELPWHVTFPKLSSPYEAEKPAGQQRFSPPYSDQASHGEMHGFRVDPSATAAAAVTRVDKGSAAEAAGLAAGDAIESINGQSIRSMSDAKALLFDVFVGELPLKLGLRSGKSIAIPAAAMPERSRPVHPAQLYSAIDASLLAWLLWAYFPFRRHDGACIALLLTIHPITRFLLEIIRTDEPAVFGTGLSISQNISFGLLALGLLLWWYLSRQPRGVTWPLVAAVRENRGTRRRGDGEMRGAGV